jgi:hypothetical protein
MFADAAVYGIALFVVGKAAKTIKSSAFSGWFSYSRYFCNCRCH